jgi:radical SAM protein with 4Fe4S-binding SPASM domain
MASYKEINGLGRRVNVFTEWVKRGFDLEFFWYRFRWNWVARHDTVLKFPLHLDIEVTEACNLACVMCVHGTTGVPITGRIDMSFARNMIDQAADNGTKSIKFNWRGEPALHTGLEDLVRYAKEKGILEVQINTNGIPFNTRRIERIIDAGLDRVIFSVDGASKESYEAIRVGSDWERLNENIRKFHEIRKAKRRVKPFIRVQMVRQEENAHEVDLFFEQWRDIADDIAVKDVTDRGQGNVLYVGDQVAIGRRRCNQPWQRMIVARDGKAFPCCSDWYRTYEIGDATRTPLKEIWKGERMKRLRDVNRQKRLDDVDPCRNCFVLSSYEWREMTPRERVERDRLAAESQDKAGRVVRVDEARKEPARLPSSVPEGADAETRQRPVRVASGRK